MALIDVKTRRLECIKKLPIDCYPEQATKRLTKNRKFIDTLGRILGGSQTRMYSKNKSE